MVWTWSPSLPQEKRSRTAIKRKSEELGKPFGQRRQDLAKQVEDFQKQASLMKEDARKTKAAELEKKMQDFQKQGADAEKQLQQFQEQSTGAHCSRNWKARSRPWPSRRSWIWSWTSAMPGSSTWTPNWISPTRCAASSEAKGFMTRTLGELAAFLGGELQGPADLSIEGIAALDQATPREIYLHHP